MEVFSGKKYSKFPGPVTIIGFGSIGAAVLTLLERHFWFDPKQLTVIDPDPAAIARVSEMGYNLLTQAITPENYTAVLSGIFQNSGGFCINLSVDVSSHDIMVFCRRSEVLYIDTVVEPWPGFYFGDQLNVQRTNYILRQTIRDLAISEPGGPTAISCCGANPGMVSWLVKDALLQLAVDLGRDVEPPITRTGWAELMQGLGVKGIHIAERDTQVVSGPRMQGVFVNTWSVDGFLSEALQPAEIGWGTHEAYMPKDARTHLTGCGAAIWLNRAGAETRVRTWCPSHGAQLGYLITHNEAISLADYFTVGDPDAPEYRPTCHYAYHPCDAAVLSLHELLGSGKIPSKKRILQSEDILGGKDELGVLLYGHERNALWYGSRLSIEEARHLAPNVNATGLQVASAVIAGIVWGLENPCAGIVEAEEMDHVRCLEIQRPYLGPIEAHYTNWTPIQSQFNKFLDHSTHDDPWAFHNVLVE